MAFKAILVLCYFGLFNLLIYRFRQLQFNVFKPWVTLVVFNLKFLIGIFIWAVYTFYYKDVEQNDVHKFYNDALVLHEIREESPQTFWLLMKGAQFKVSEGSKVAQLKNWNRNFDEAPINENRTIIKLNVFLMFFSFKTYFVHILFMCFVSLIGIVLLTNAILQFAPPKTGILALFALLLPSLLFWTSGVMKEPVLMLGIGLFVYGLVHSNSGNIIRLVAILTGALLILFTKFFVLACLVPPAIAFVLFRKREATGFLLLKYTVVHVLLLFAALNIHHVMPQINLPQMLVNKQEHSISEASYFNAGSRMDIPVLEPNTWSILKAAPVGILNTLVRPLVWESKNPMMLASAVENVFIIVFLVLCIVSTDWKKQEHWNLFLFLLMSALSYYALIGMATPVAGNLVRYKAPLLPLLMLAFIFRVRDGFVADNLGFVLRGKR